MSKKVFFWISFSDNYFYNFHLGFIIRRYQFLKFSKFCHSVDMFMFILNVFIKVSSFHFHTPEILNISIGRSPKLKAKINMYVSRRCCNLTRWKIYNRESARYHGEIARYNCEIYGNICKYIAGGLRPPAPTPEEVRWAPRVLGHEGEQKRV